MASEPKFPLDETFRSETFDAEKVFLYVRSMLDEYPGLQDNSKLSSYRSAVVQNLVLQLTTWCVAGRIPSNETTEHVEWPDGVWQTLKARWMPKWFQERFPIRHIERTFKTRVNHYFVCPHLATKPQGDHIRFMATGTRTAGRI